MQWKLSMWHFHCLQGAAFYSLPSPESETQQRVGLRGKQALNRAKFFIHAALRKTVFLTQTPSQRVYRWMSFVVFISTLHLFVKLICLRCFWLIATLIPNDWPEKYMLFFTPLLTDSPRYSLSPPAFQCLLWRANPMVHIIDCAVRGIQCTAQEGLIGVYSP